MEDIHEKAKKVISDLMNQVNFEDSLVTNQGGYVFRGESYFKSPDFFSSSLKKILPFGHEKTYIQDRETNIIDRVRKSYFPEKSSYPEIATDLRHYGCELNLIDFTYNFFIALFFACHGNYSKPGRVIFLKKIPEYRYINDLKFREKIDNPPETQDYVLIDPVKTSLSKNRVIIQHSVFIYPLHKGIIEIKPIRTSEDCFVKEIKGSDKKDILRYLRQTQNLSLDTVFPDLFGFIEQERYNLYLGSFFSNKSKFIKMLESGEMNQKFIKDWLESLINQPKKDEEILHWIKVLNDCLNKPKTLDLLKKDIGKK